LIETHQLLVCADNVNMLGKHHKNTDVLLEASREDGIEVNIEKTKNMVNCDPPPNSIIKL
jgi:hypothetical protein